MDGQDKELGKKIKMWVEGQFCLWRETSEENIQTIEILLSLLFCLKNNLIKK